MTLIHENGYVHTIGDIKTTNWKNYVFGAIENGADFLLGVATIKFNGRTVCTLHPMSLTLADEYVEPVLKKKVYYAHVMGIYNTPQELRDINTLQSLGFEVVNPNQPGIQKAVNDAKEKYKDLSDGANKAFEEVFNALIDDCQIIAFRSLPDGKITSGVFKEIVYARSKGKLIIELPNSLGTRSMSYAATVEYLHDIGQR